MRVADYFKRNRQELEENASAILGNMENLNQPFAENAVEAGSEGAFPNQLFLEAGQRIIETADLENGGFGEAPKFPPSMNLEFLLALRATATIERNPQGADRIDEIIRGSLQAMARGGLFDQVGGGFTRYSVDDSWTIPHFEKMLYDNALLLRVYARGWQRYGDPLFRAAATETVEWLRREMSVQGGGFAAVDRRRMP